MFQEKDKLDSFEKYSFLSLSPVDMWFPAPHCRCLCLCPLLMRRTKGDVGQYKFNVSSKVKNDRMPLSHFFTFPIRMNDPAPFVAIVLYDLRDNFLIPRNLLSGYIHPVNEIPSLLKHTIWESCLRIIGSLFAQHCTIQYMWFQGGWHIEHCNVCASLHSVIAIKSFLGE